MEYSEAITISEQAQNKIKQISTSTVREQISLLFLDVSDLTSLALDYFNEEDENSPQVKQAIDLLDHVVIRSSELHRDVLSPPVVYKGNIDFFIAEADRLNTFLQLAIDALISAESQDLFTYALATYCPTDDTGEEEADIIVSDESMKFLEVRGLNGTVRELIKEWSGMKEQPHVKGVLIVHSGTVQKLSKALAGVNV